MTDNTTSSSLSDQEIHDLLSAGDDVILQRKKQDIEDLNAISGYVSYQEYSNDDWVIIAEFSELISRAEVRGLLKAAGENKRQLDGIDLYNGFAIHCSAACSGLAINPDIKSFFDAVIHHYSHTKPLDMVCASFVGVMQPLFDFLIDAYRESPQDRLKVASIESRWKKQFAKSLACDVVQQRSAD